MGFNKIKKHLLANGDGYCLDMISAIERKMNRDTDYAKIVQSWLKYGGTIILKETICGPFEKASFIDYHKRKGVPVVYFNIWAAIDNAWIWCRYDPTN